MKKFYVVVSVLGFGMTDGMITPVNTNTGIVSRTETSELVTRSTAVVNQGQDNQNDALVRVVNFREIGEIAENENTASIAVRDLFRSEQGSEVLSDWYVRDYPLQRRILSYQHNLANGISYPIEEHFVDINDLQFLSRSGRVVVNDEYINVHGGIAHQRRNTGQFAYDDANLRARPFTEIFISTENGNVIVDGAAVRPDTQFTAYIPVSGPTIIDVGSPDANSYQRTETSEQWRRPDGTIYKKKTEGGHYVQRPSYTPPVPPKQPVVVNQQPPQVSHRKPIESRVFRHPFNPKKWF